ncbi:serine/threonine-protein kinase rio1-like [Zophobas morio]|uniref:serine/threonine-protein kinase rio1-like n=1 Tax=Zophobas morio TaxID=2755281 RepID=UPI0030828693
MDDVLRNFSVSDDDVYDFQSDFYLADDFSVIPSKKVSNKAKVQLQPVTSAIQKYYRYMNIHQLANLSSLQASSSINAARHKLLNQSARNSDKSLRATTEQVLDGRTRLILFKLLSRGLFSEINGCLSTGKEANVYYAKNDKQEFAVKIYKTSILIFKDRNRYIDGEFRFRNGHTSGNPRKLVKLWAEKELRNYLRLQKSGIPSPTPVELRQHVLVMSLVGSDGRAAPRLKDANITDDRACELYYQCVKDMRRLYTECRLVHGDLSEYNLLYWNKMLYFIDVSQAVEHDHPRALEFLRVDCANITDFFRKRNVGVLPMRKLFDFITDISLNDAQIDAYLDSLQSTLFVDTCLKEEDKVDEEVFKKSYIPRTLDTAYNFEEDVFKILRGEETDVMYHKVLGLKADLTGAEEDIAPACTTNTEAENSINKSSCSEEGNSSLSTDEENSLRGNGECGAANIISKDRIANKERKKMIREINRERRLKKIPKKIKKKKYQLAKK